MGVSRRAVEIDHCSCRSLVVPATLSATVFWMVVVSLLASALLQVQVVKTFHEGDSSRRGASGRGSVKPPAAEIKFR